MAFVKGQSGNPAGRKSPGAIFARLVRSHTKDGLELLEHALKVFREGDDEMKWEAMKWLADRGFGKAVEQVAIVDEDAAKPMAVPSNDLEDGLGPEGHIQ